MRSPSHSSRVFSYAIKSDIKGVINFTRSLTVGRSMVLILILYWLGPISSKLNSIKIIKTYYFLVKCFFLFSLQFNSYCQLCSLTKHDENRDGIMFSLLQNVMIDLDGKLLYIKLKCNIQTVINTQLCWQFLLKSFVNCVVITISPSQCSGWQIWYIVINSSGEQLCK